jgi:N-methylhydantoinase A
MVFLGVDTGGTFTDFVLWKDGRLKVHKLLSTPHAPEQAILQGVADLGLQAENLRLIHGSTVATNAVLEGKGVKTLFVTNHGFADMLSIGRQNRRELYNLQPHKIDPPVPQECCVEVGGRLSANGELQEPITRQDLVCLEVAIAEQQPQAVAVNLLFSWLDDTQEQSLSRHLPDDLFVSLSSEVLPEIREYERGMATWLNAWVGPLVQGYLQHLQEGLHQASISVMQSSGDTVLADQAGEQAVRMLLSGPAGGLVAANFLGSKSDCRRMLSFDMGGTSTDVALLDGEPQLTTEGRIGNYPVAVPMVDMHTIGAGGGSIAWLDEGGMLQVGPESAGATPGPVCYGQGGQQVTVTDANLILGRLLPDVFLGGKMCLDADAAATRMQQLAQRLGCDIQQAASGIVRIANEHMARALRTMSVQRGVDPVDFTLVSFGGAGGLHVCALAEELGMSKAMVPVHGGVLSALGMLVARPGRQLSRTWLTALDELSEEQLCEGLGSLAESAYGMLQTEGISRTECELRSTLDIRYQGQSYTLSIPWENLNQVKAAFHQCHVSRYGHKLDLPLELVNIRVSVRGQGLPLELGSFGYKDNSTRAVDDQTVAHYVRQDLKLDEKIIGPAVITENVATTWLEQGWHCTLDRIGNLILGKA